MRDLDDKKADIYQRFDILVEFLTKLMHSMATTLHFLHANKEEKALGKTSERTYSIFGFLVDN